MLIREVMHAPAETIATSTPITDVAVRFNALDGDAIVVVRDVEPAGIITRTDLVNVLAAGENIEGQTAESVMSHPPITVSESAPIQMGAATLYEHNVDQALVMEGETVIGLLRTSDLVP